MGFDARMVILAFMSGKNSVKKELIEHHGETNTPPSLF
jgi:hypothetical protein